MTIAACSDTPITPGVVVFNAAEFVTAYPEFTGTSTPLLTANFYLASINIENCCGSVIRDPNIRQALLYLLTAHVTFLFTPSLANNQQPPGIVGRINSATEGSVSVSAEFPTTIEGAWFNQTKYGAQFWAMTAAIRTMHYVPAPQHCCNGGLGILGPFDVGFGPGWDNGGWP